MEELSQEELDLIRQSTETDNGSNREYMGIPEFTDEELGKIPLQFGGGRPDYESPYSRLGEYDKDIILGQNQQRLRATNQPGSTQMFNAVVGGLGSGVLTGIESAGYILDFENNLARLKGVDNVETNLLSQWAKEKKEELTQRQLPIYRRSNELIDWGDSGFYWESVRGIVDSAVGFGGVGLGASLAVKAGAGGLKMMSRALRASRAARAARSEWYIKALNKTQQGLAAGLEGASSGAAQTTSAAYITNFGEGKMMALEMYENTVDEIKAANPEMSDAEISEIAGRKADAFMLYNKLFMASDAFALAGLARGAGTSRYAARDLSLKGFMKSFGKLSTRNPLAQGATESLEEIGQNIGQMEAAYQAKLEAGLEQDDIPTDLASRVYEFGTSDQALLEGAMGFFGGPVQYAIIQGPQDYANRKNIQEQYKLQQDQVEKNKEFFEKKVKTHTEMMGAIEKAKAKGEAFTAIDLADTMYSDILYDNFEAGTTERLERQLQELHDNKEQAKESGLESNYQEHTGKMLTELKESEAEYIKMKRRYDHPAFRPFHKAIFQTQRKINIANDRLTGVNTKYNDLLTEYTRRANEQQAEVQHEVLTTLPALEQEKIVIQEELWKAEKKREEIREHNLEIKENKAAGIPTRKRKRSEKSIGETISRINNQLRQVDKKISNANDQISTLDISITEDEVLNDAHSLELAETVREKGLINNYIKQRQTSFNEMTNLESAKAILAQKKEEFDESIKTAQDEADDEAGQALREINKTPPTQDVEHSEVEDKGHKSTDGMRTPNKETPTSETVTDLIIKGEIQFVDEFTGKNCGE